MDDDSDITTRIDELETQRRAIEQAHIGTALSDDEAARLRDIDVEVDRSWDLLRQRRALRESGGDPGQAHTRPASTVEDYQQ